MTGQILRNQKLPGRCIFCGEGKLSKEHVFPNWLRSIFPRDANSKHTFGTIDNPGSGVIGIPSVTARERPGHVGSKKVRVVCARCNNGWLSQLEETTRPILLPLISGRSARVTPDTQKRLATWAAKTAMVAERLRPDKDGISDDERKWLMQNGAPPAHWNVWIAAYSGVAWRTLGIYQSRGTLHVPAIGRPAVMQHHAESTVWGMGHLLFLVVGTNWPDMAKQIARARGRGLFRIWPASPLSLVWPPLDVLGDPQANAVANFFSLTGAFDNSLNPLAGWTFTP